MTADHGNAEEMIGRVAAGNTAHSTDKVPLIVLDQLRRAARGGGLVRCGADSAVFLGAAVAPGDDRAGRSATNE